MHIEYEARFTNIDSQQILAALAELGGERTIERILMRRSIFEHPKLKDAHSWLRLRDEGHRTTLAFKTSAVGRQTVDSIQEAEVTVGSFSEASSLLTAMGYKVVREQENYREEVVLEDVKFDFDTWPGLDTFLEIEGPDQGAVTLAAKRVGLDIASAVFGSVDEEYMRKLGVDILEIPVLTFALAEEQFKSSSSHTARAV